MDKNHNDKIDYIAVTKAEKEKDCESIYVFPVESIMEVNNDDKSKHWKKIENRKFIKQETNNVWKP